LDYTQLHYKFFHFGKCVEIGDRSKPNVVRSLFLKSEGPARPSAITKDEDIQVSQHSSSPLLAVWTFTKGEIK